MCRVTSAGRTNNNNNNNNEAHTHFRTHAHTLAHTHCGCVKGVLRLCVYRFLLVFCGVMLTKALKQLEKGATAGRRQQAAGWQEVGVVVLLG